MRRGHSWVLVFVAVAVFGSESLESMCFDGDAVELAIYRVSLFLRENVSCFVNCVSSKI